jgi:hypothetical protein
MFLHAKGMFVSAVTVVCPGLSSTVVDDSLGHPRILSTHRLEHPPINRRLRHSAKFMIIQSHATEQSNYRDRRLLWVAR